MIGFLSDEPTTGRVVVVVGALVVFLGLFFQGIRGRMTPRPTSVIARAYVIDLSIATALTIADRPDWNLLFYYVVALAGTRFTRPWK
jgi:quinol-cytochrome oxidoreductase complex cytochrome b subunit